MHSSSRKLVTIITEAAIEKDILSRLETLGVTGYTITDARGKGHRGTRTSSWDLGSNIRIEIVCDAPLAASVIDCLKTHYYSNYAMILFISEVEVLRPEKF